MRLEHLAEIHPIELIARKNDDFAGAWLSQVAKILSHSVCRSLIPIGSFSNGLLSGQDFNETSTEGVEAISAANVAV